MNVYIQFDVNLASYLAILFWIKVFGGLTSLPSGSVISGAKTLLGWTSNIYGTLLNREKNDLNKTCHLSVESPISSFNFKSH